MKTQLNSKVSVLALAVATIWAGSAAADTLTPTATSAGTALPVTIPQTAITYTVLDSASAVVGTTGLFTYNATTGLWNGPDSTWTNAYDSSGNVQPNVLWKNPGTSSVQTVTITEPTAPALTASGAATTTAVGAAFNGTETTTSSELGAGATISNNTISVSAPGVQAVTANPDPISYAYGNLGNNTLDTTGGAAYSGTTSVTGTGTTTASGSVTVTSATPVDLQSGSYTVTFPGTSTSGTLSGNSMALSEAGLFFNALSGTSTINTTTGVVSASVTSTPTTAITSAGITTNSMTVNGATLTTTLTTTGNATVGGSLDMTNGQIHNLAAGTSAGDAVNLGQLQSGLESVYDDFNKAKKRINKGIASVAAMANIPEVDESKTFSLGLGLGSYDGDGAIAIGGSYRLAPSTVLKGSIATGSSGGKTAYGLGLSTSW